MSKEKRSLIEELTWKDVRDTVAGSCKDLADIIDNLSPGKEFTVFKVLYPFGMKILDKSSFYLPFGLNSSVAITDNEVDPNIKNQLLYSTPPLGIITKNSIEVFFDIHRKVFSLAIFGKGLELGIWEHFGWSSPYSITSGARSLYMLPKISESLSHKQLKRRFGILEAPPKHLYDHWQVFSQLANSSNFPSTWFCEVIFLSAKWADAIKNDEAWLKLAAYVNKKAWDHSAHSRKKAALDVVWEIFVRSLSNKELKFDPYIVDTLKHIMYICTGTVPASTPFIGNTDLGPLKSIQTIYEDQEGYGLNEYVATIMQPQYFSINQPKPVYYSLQLPTLLESLPRTKKVTSVIDNVRDLSELLNCFLSSNSELWTKLIIEKSNLKEILENLQVDYFHGDMFAYGDLIKSSSKMPEFDQNLKYDPLNDKKRIFASNSSFLRGCVRIAKKTQPSASSKTNMKDKNNMLPYKVYKTQSSNV